MSSENWPQIVGDVIVRARKGETVGCLVIMTPTDYEAMKRSVRDVYGSDNPMVGSNSLMGIPVELVPGWVGPPRILEADEVEEYRQAARGLDKRLNPDWRLKT